MHHFCKPYHFQFTFDTTNQETMGKSWNSQQCRTLCNHLSVYIVRFVTVNISYPQLYVELDENEPLMNESKPTVMLCKDLRHQCKYIQVEYDVSLGYFILIIFAIAFFATFLISPIISFAYPQNYSRKPITAIIPIGNANLSTPITFITLLLSVVSSLYLIYSMHKKSEAMENASKLKCSTKLKAK